MGNSHPRCHPKGTRWPKAGTGACYGQASLILSFKAWPSAVRESAVSDTE